METREMNSVNLTYVDMSAIELRARQMRAEAFADFLARVWALVTRKPAVLRGGRVAGTA